LKALEDGRKLVCLNIQFVHNGDDPAVTLAVAPPFQAFQAIITAFRGLGCNGRVRVNWCCAAEFDVGEMCGEECERAASLVKKLKGVIIE
jgi:hypothetical protein